jgi:anti-sigma regulatory factor (Ser/Thr protein kinase)
MDTLTVRGVLQDIEPVIDYAVTAAHEAGLDDRETHRVRLAVDEIATNIITHGYGEAGLDGEITISAECDEEQFAICLEDTGPTYDPRDAPPPNLNAPCDARKAGGLGVYLALWALDQFEYEHDNEVNRSTLIVKRPYPPKSHSPGQHP